MSIFEYLYWTSVIVTKPVLINDLFFCCSFFFRFNVLLISLIFFRLQTTGKILRKKQCNLLTGTGAWESALTNTLSPGDRIVSFLIGQFSLLWIDQQQRLGFNVDVVESEWGHGANLDVLASKLPSDRYHSIKNICIVHNETATRT